MTQTQSGKERHTTPAKVSFEDIKRISNLELISPNMKYMIQQCSPNSGQSSRKNTGRQGTHKHENDVRDFTKTIEGYNAR